MKVKTYNAAREIAVNQQLAEEQPQVESSAGSAIEDAGAVHVLYTTPIKRPTLAASVIPLSLGYTALGYDPAAFSLLTSPNAAQAV